MIGTDLAQQWATRINRTMAESVAAILATGQAFIEAKRQLKHGAFKRLFADHPEPVIDPVRCSASTAQRFMAIAQHPVLAKAAHGQLLPPSWRTLYELTKVPEPMLTAALGDGRIHPGLERRAIRALIGHSPRGGMDGGRSEEESATQLGFRLLHALNELWRIWPESYREDFVLVLEQRAKSYRDLLANISEDA